MYATITLPTDHIFKAEILEILDYHTTRFNALRARGPMIQVNLRNYGAMWVWADEITLHP